MTVRQTAAGDGPRWVDTYLSIKPPCSECLNTKRACDLRIRGGLSLGEGHFLSKARPGGPSSQSAWGRGSEPSAKRRAPGATYAPSARHRQRTFGGACPLDADATSPFINYCLNFVKTVIDKQGRDSICRQRYNCQEKLTFFLRRMGMRGPTTEWCYSSKPLKVMNKGISADGRLPPII